MNAITETRASRPSLIATMASKYNMDPDQFQKTVRSTVMPAQHTNEQFAALMLVAHEYGLNPVVKEIYAFPAKGGGIVPVVSIDGWLNLVNSHPQCDGFDIDFHDDENGQPISCTCRMYRKDRGRPVVVTEYLSECIRQTDPWKMKHRMLRHKAVIQAARYAFGFSGIYDEDEGAKIAGMKDITPPKPPAPPPPVEAVEPEKPAQEPEPVYEGEVVDATEIFERVEEALACANDAETIEEVWTDFDVEATFDGDDTNIEIANAIKNRRLKQLGFLDDVSEAFGADKEDLKVSEFPGDPDFVSTVQAG